MKFLAAKTIKSIRTVASDLKMGFVVDVSVDVGVLWMWFEMWVWRGYGGGGVDVDVVPDVVRMCFWMLVGVFVDDFFFFLRVRRCR